VSNRDMQSQKVMRQMTYQAKVDLRGGKCHGVASVKSCTQSSGG
jgi:hypothetical protein